MNINFCKALFVAAFIGMSSSGYGQTAGHINPFLSEYATPYEFLLLIRLLFKIIKRHS